MATYERRETHHTQVDFAVPAPEPWGACWVEVTKAIDAAMLELVEAGRLKQGAVPADNEIRVRPEDDQVIVSIEFTVDG